MRTDPSRGAASAARILHLALVALLAGCTLAPEGYDDERERALLAGRGYAEPFERRALPELPPAPDWPLLLERALLANGALEADYHAWVAALERVEQAAGWPNAALMPSFSVMVADGAPTTLDSATLNLGFDGSEMLELPVKTRARAEVALAEARASAEAFRAARLALRREVLEAWLDLGLALERERLAREDLELVRAVASTAAGRVGGGGEQAALLAAEIDLARAESRRLDAEAAAADLRARLNGLLARAPGSPLDVPELPEPRALPLGDAEILALGVRDNPELRALLEQAEGREDALELARLMVLPNVVPFAALTGDVAQTIGAAVLLPTTLPEIRGAVREARALRDGARAAARQAELDRDARLVAVLVALRNAERQAALFEETVRPAARLAADALRETYAAGSGGLAELIEAERVLVEVRLAIAEARVERERRVAELETVLGVELETLPARGAEEAGRG